LDEVAIVGFEQAKQCPDANLLHKERQFLDGLLEAVDCNGPTHGAE
jgi:hypothetical protein